MKNIIDAIIGIVTNPKLDLVRHYSSNNRANNMGDALEEYVKDIFAGTLNESDDEKRNSILAETFSYLGNSNNPPDSMLRNGDAIEVKKLEGFGEIQLNSSHPKRFMLKSNKKINAECRNCSDWPINGTRDMLYIFGVCKNQCIRQLCMVYGTELCDDINTYSRVEDIITNALENAEDINNAGSSELGRVNEVDKLGISSLRIRGMWIMGNPFSVFKDIFNINARDTFTLVALINNDKYNSMTNKSELEELVNYTDGLTISDVQVKSPIETSNLVNCKLIKYKIGE